VSDELEHIDLSVIIVTYNSAGEISACLLSLLRELSAFRYEIVVIDNASADETKQQLARYSDGAVPGSGRLILIENDENAGFTRALNQGLSLSTGDYLLTLNPDTVMQPESLTILMTVLHDRTDIGIVAPQLLNPDGTIQASCRRFPRRRDILYELVGLSRIFPGSRFNAWKMGDFAHDSKRSVEQPQGACLLFSRAVFEKTGEWDQNFPMFFSDVDWCKRVKSAGFDIVFEPAAQVMHHKGASIAKRKPAMIWSSHRSLNEYLKKYENRSTFPGTNTLWELLLITAAVVRILGSLIFTKTWSGNSN
jgi:GT2 family glycosyltransferase